MDAQTATRFDGRWWDGSCLPLRVQACLHAALYRPARSRPSGQSVVRGMHKVNPLSRVPEYVHG